MSAMDGFINFFIFDFTHPFREEIGTCIRYIRKASAKCTRNYVLRHAIARAFFFKLDEVAKGSCFCSSFEILVDP